MHLFTFLPLLACAPATLDDSAPAEDVLDPAGDEDSDGLTNEEEEELGTDYDEEDSDDDGFDDGDEVDDGTNPNWEWSHVFDEGDYLIGNCPEQPDEDNAGPTGVGQYNGSEWDAYQEGDVMHNLALGGSDMFGQDVPVYTFCGNYTVVTESAEWCGPCQDLAAEMASDTETIRKKYPNFTFYEYLYQDQRGGDPSKKVLERWSETYGLAGIPVVAPEDNTSDETNWINASGGIPATLVLAPDMTVIWSGVDHPETYYLTSAKEIKEIIEAYEDSL